MSGAGAILRWHLSTMPNLQPRSPLSRAAGEGPGVRAALTFPPAPLLSHAVGAEGGEDDALISLQPPSSSTLWERKGG